MLKKLHFEYTDKFHDKDIFIVWNWSILGEFHSMQDIDVQVEVVQSVRT